MKTKIILFIALIITALVSCDNDNKIESDDSLVFSYRHWGGWSGLDENLKITKNYTFYSITYKVLGENSKNVEYSDNIKTSREVWNVLEKSFDLETFNKIQSGKSSIPLDGRDAMFSVIIKGKEYSFFNGYDDEHYKQMQEFFDAMYEQIKYFEDKKN